MSTSNTLISSLSAASAVEAAIEWVTPRLGASEILVVAATRAAGDEFVRALPGAGSFGSASIHAGADGVDVGEPAAGGTRGGAGDAVGDGSDRGARDP